MEKSETSALFSSSADVISDSQMEVSADDSDASAKASPVVMTTVSTQTDDYDIEEEDDDAYYIDMQSEDVGLLTEIYDERNRCDEALFVSSDEIGSNPIGVDLTTTAPDFDDDFGRTVDFEYEEITIFRKNNDQKIGLTLCYGSAHDEITDIFVNEVDPESLAGVDGRIKEGDHILQINGFDVHTRQQAVRMFADGGATITLLLARPAAAVATSGGYLHGNGHLLEFQRSCCDEENSLQPREMDPSFSASLEKVAAKPAIAADDVESQIAVLNEELRLIRLQYEDFVASHRKDQRLPAADPPDVTRSPRMVPRMGTRRDHPSRQPPAELPAEVAQGASAAAPPQGGTAQGLLLDRLGRRHAQESVDRKRSSKRTSQQRRATSADDSSGSRGVVLPSLAEKPEELSSLQRLLSKPSHSDREQQMGGGQADGAQKEWSSDGDGCMAAGVGQAPEAAQQKTPASLQALYGQYVEVMYTNKANLQHTIMVQQNLFHQQWLAKQKLKAAEDNETSFHQPHSSASDAASRPTASKSKPLPDKNPPVTVTTTTTATTGSGVQMEWVVKRRADGSRYITRRPVRSQILKERARKLAEERRGLTTDDDAVSELKVGRYWSKEDRKRHLEKARHHRRQKELLLRQQMESTKENHELMRAAEGLLPPEASDRKAARQRDIKTAEDADSIGQRDRDSKSHSPLLSVTTV